MKGEDWPTAGLQAIAKALSKDPWDVFFDACRMNAFALPQTMTEANLIKAMREIIEGVDWMSPETKKHALEKLATLRLKIGYPDKWRDYSGLRIARTS